MPQAIISPFPSQSLLALHAGDSVLLSGVIYTARDAAHARFCRALDQGQELPLDLRGQTVFYAGPSPTPPGRACGAIGRMDPYTPQLLHYGVRALIGKGDRGNSVRDALAQTGAVYFTAVGGCAAYMAACVESVSVVAYADLGTESVKRLVVRDMPLTVAIDAQGNDFYSLGQSRYLAR